MHNPTGLILYYANTPEHEYCMPIIIYISHGCEEIKILSYMITALHSRQTESHLIQLNEIFQYWNVGTFEHSLKRFQEKHTFLPVILLIKPFMTLDN